MLTLRAILSSPQEAACETLLSDLADMISYPSGAGLVVKMKSFEDVGEAIVDMASPLLAILLLHYGEGAALRCCILFEIMGCLLGICIVRQLVPGHGTDAENFRAQLAPTSASSVMEEFLSAWTNLNSSVKFMIALSSVQRFSRVSSVLATPFILSTMGSIDAVAWTLLVAASGMLIGGLIVSEAGAPAQKSFRYLVP